MPIYEYQCEACEHTFEEWQKDFSERAVPCPECGGQSQRLISNTAFILKGSGWYVTDYARNGGNGSNGTNGANGNGKSTTAETAKDAGASESASTNKDTSSSKGQDAAASKSSSSTASSSSSASS